MRETIDRVALDRTLAALLDRLHGWRSAHDHWEGRLASSALSTSTATIALTIAARAELQPPHASRVRALAEDGVAWLVRHQNTDGGWGDTTISRTNISTTALACAALSIASRGDRTVAGALARADRWLCHAAGGSTPAALRTAILRRYGNDRTFSVPILTVLALTGKLGPDQRAAWQSVPQLPFELAVLPHSWFQYVRLPVVSYALPALVAIGQVRHHFAPTRNPALRVCRRAVCDRTLETILRMQPESGGYLEATPLTSFVVMSLAAKGLTRSPVVEQGVRFLIESAREDGSWPIDTNLSTWVTTLAIVAARDAGDRARVDEAAVAAWLLNQQSVREHPFTHAAPGGWAWTPLSGGVTDADDTSGALLALHSLGVAARDAVAAAVRWLLGVQNRDGGMPTFCRGWGALPFDRSTPEITAHALRAWSVWYPALDPALQALVRRAADRALAFLVRSQRADGAWIPLWFGNEAAADESNPTYGTARAILGLQSALARGQSQAVTACERGMAWLLRSQNADGGWGGEKQVPSSLEETGVALAALASCENPKVMQAIIAGSDWVIEATRRGSDARPAPIGLYFARLWYFEELYPFIFAIEGLAAVSKRLTGSRSPASATARSAS